MGFCWRVWEFQTGVWHICLPTWKCISYLQLCGINVYHAHCSSANLHASTHNGYYTAIHQPADAKHERIIILLPKNPKFSKSADRESMSIVSHIFSSTTQINRLRSQSTKQVNLHLCTILNRFIVFLICSSVSAVPTTIARLFCMPTTESESQNQRGRERGNAVAVVAL